LQKRQDTPRPRIHWCATGPFAFVPVHAAGIYQGPGQECCSDYVVSSYTPTLSALLHAQKKAKTYTAAELDLLLVSGERAEDRSLPPLRFVKREVLDISEVASEAGASSTLVTRASDVLGSLKSANVVHLACHGIQHSTEPHKSHFCLDGADLTVATLMDLNLKGAFFAFLSACETAKGDRKHADEAVHLAATMLFVGFKSVVATMW
jgi:CHAT domain-containing protein